MNDKIVHGDVEAGNKIARLAGGECFDQRSETCIARYKDDKLMGGMIYSNFSRRSLEMHVAGFRPMWVNRDLLWVAFDYPFMQLGCEKVFAKVQASNATAMKFNLNLGFTIEATLKDVYPDGDMHILSMYKQDCRHLRIRPRGCISRN